MKTVLLYPGISGIGFNSYGKGMEASWISHGLCSISAYAKRQGFPIELIDLRCLKGWKHFEKVILEKRPDVVGITMMSVDYNPAMKSIGIIKKILPEAVVVVGGPHPTLKIEELEGDRRIDHIITGEGESAFSELLKRIGKGEPSARVIQGVGPEDLDTLPFADRTLFKNLEYPLPVDGFESPFVTIIAGRGCRFNCSFCQPAERKIFGKHVRRRSPRNVIDELVSLRQEFNFKSMMIHDDCITEDRTWVIEFCRLYKESGLSKPFACQSRADIICRNEDMVAMMADAGLRLMFIGFESGSQRVLNFIRKGTKVEHNFRAAEICRKYGIKIWANYMMGIPTETKDEVQDTVRMIRTIRPDFYSPAFYTPHPGSDLFNYCEEHGLSLIKSHDSYRRNATEAKIKGVDYGFLYVSLLQSKGINPPFKRNKFLLSAQRRIIEYFLKHQHIKAMVRFIVRKILAGRRAQ